MGLVTKPKSGPFVFLLVFFLSLPLYVHSVALILQPAHLTEDRQAR